MTKAFCISCGAEKQSPHKKCSACGLLPRKKSDIVKSVWLSTDRCLSTKELEANFSSSLEELQSFASNIKNGKHVTYPENEIGVLTKQFEAVSEVSWLKVILVGMPFVIIPIIALALFIYKTF
ncbi:hypothetical protein [Alkalimarinus sediminis]|uniref:Uncharacterized protein n=1 Tax=Alkalimarinus sediminis TaxID=1632866 RepID=A0A9E8KJ18_9ALTE|nr:hypothetical protein [Alkalimarinus sediminis]UZW74526.1 hypothetical protein NNL22_16105 [Alkalimarinus sediminis]